jgi:beta-galactosidase
VLVQVYMDSAPGWMGRAHPDARFVSSNGQAIDPESSPGYCLDHAAVRKADLAFYRAFAERFGKSRAFVGVDLWSEPHVINWANPTYIPNPEFCFCPHTRARFRDWLRQKYGTLDAAQRGVVPALRRLVGRGRAEPPEHHPLLHRLHRLEGVHRRQAREDLKERYEAVKTAAPHLAVVSHAAGVGLFASPHHWEGQADDWSMAAQVDYYGTSFYPKHSAFVDRDVPWRAALLDFTRSFGYDRGPARLLDRRAAGRLRDDRAEREPHRDPGDLRTWTWSALARGARASTTTRGTR